MLWIISAYSPSQNTIESSKTIQNLLCSLPAKHAENILEGFFFDHVASYQLPGIWTNSIVADYQVTSLWTNMVR